MKEIIDKNSLKNILEDYLIMEGFPTAGFFPCLNPDHTKQHPEVKESMSFDSAYKRVYCWVCHAKYDVFDLIGMKYGLKNFSQQKEKAIEIYIQIFKNTNSTAEVSTTPKTVSSSSIPRSFPLTLNDLLAEVFQEMGMAPESVEFFWKVISRSQKRIK